MKVKALLVAVIMSCIVGGVSSLSAQAANPQNLYIKVLYIESIAPSTLGYKVDYRTSNGHHQTTYIPIKWFGKAGGMGEIVYEDNPSVPFMEVVYANNKFHHVRLHVSPSYDRGNWTYIPQGTDLSKEFNVETLNIEWN